ncbi:MAG TPA: 4-hydroxyphenylpyruvate dioxygenase [Pseudonocardiaceae bacterium]|jgi:4-hydroxymandelate synthase|nr:4-hydroxyphenylpyruvate dioxygenase [Pseudonocardiaceae bacterium]
MHVQGIDHVEFYVGNADEVAAALCATYGFRVQGQVRLPTEDVDHRSVLIRQNDIRLLLTEGLTETHPATLFVRKHGDGPATIALSTDDPNAALTDAVAAGAVPVSATAPLSEVSATSRVRITAFGDVAHTFVRPGELDEVLIPMAEPLAGGDSEPLEMLDILDHVAVCVPAGELIPTVEYYKKVLGFGQIFEEYIEVGVQAMNSRVVQSPSGGVTLTILEPDTSRMPGQIDDFIRAHDGAGVQHLALRTDDIAGSVRTLQERGVGFLSTPGSYYDELAVRLGHIGLPVDTLRTLNVLVDQDHEGELFQIFAQSTHSRRTFFFEVIERRGALTFGSANIKALYQAVERERARTSPDAAVSR